jgi:hypothetical protein
MREAWEGQKGAPKRENSFRGLGEVLARGPSIDFGLSRYRTGRHHHPRYNREFHNPVLHFPVLVSAAHTRPCHGTPGKTCSEGSPFPHDSGGYGSPYCSHSRVAQSTPRSGSRTARRIDNPCSVLLVEGADEWQVLRFHVGERRTPLTSSPRSTWRCRPWTGSSGRQRLPGNRSTTTSGHGPKTSTDSPYRGGGSCRLPKSSHGGAKMAPVIRYDCERKGHCLLALPREGLLYPIRYDHGVRVGIECLQHTDGNLAPVPCAGRVLSRGNVCPRTIRSEAPVPLGDGFPLFKHHHAPEQGVRARVPLESSVVEGVQRPQPRRPHLGHSGDDVHVWGQPLWTAHQSVCSRGMIVSVPPVRVPEQGFHSGKIVVYVHHPSISFSPLSIAVILCAGIELVFLERLDCLRRSSPETKIIKITRDVVTKLNGRQNPFKIDAPIDGTGFSPKSLYRWSFEVSTTSRWVGKRQCREFITVPDLFKMARVLR